MLPNCCDQPTRKNGFSTFRYHLSTISRSGPIHDAAGSVPPQLRSPAITRLGRDRIPISHCPVEVVLGLVFLLCIDRLSSHVNLLYAGKIVYTDLTIHLTYRRIPAPDAFEFPNLNWQFPALTLNPQLSVLSAFSP